MYLRLVGLGILLFAFASRLASLGQTEDPTELKKMRDLYVGQRQKAQETLLHDLAAAPEGQIKALSDLEAQFQKAGDLDSLLAVRKERERFTANPDESAMKLVDSPKQLRALQEQYLVTRKDIRLTHAHTIIDLTQKYIRNLTALQRELTQKGQIEDAVKVRSEVDRVKDSDDVKAATTMVTAGGAGPAGETPASAAPSLTTAALQQLIHGEVKSWNSVTGEITCRYDFSSADQITDWEGGTLDDLRGRLVCENTTVWLLTQFKAITRIEYRGYLYSGTGGIEVRLGNDLTAEIGGGDEHKAVQLYQDNPHFPLANFEREISPFLKYDAILSFQGDTVEWTLNGASLAKVPLQKPLQYPLKIGLGRAGNKSMFDDVTISGVLSPMLGKPVPPAP